MKKVSATLGFLIASGLVLTTSVFAVGPNDRLMVKEEKIASNAAKKVENLELKRQQIASAAALKKAELDKRLLAFKDKTKAATAQKVNQNLNRINQQRTTQMTQHLGQMDNLILKIDTRISNLQSSGQDVTSAASASATAKQKISDAKAAVSAQALNDYTITATSEANIRQDAKVKRDQLLSDLKTTHQLVVDARASIAEILKVLSTITGGNSGQ